MAPHAAAVAAASLLTSASVTAGKMAAPSALSIGTRCYVPDEQRVWIPVTVLDVNHQTQTATFIEDVDADTDEYADLDGDDREPRRFDLPIVGCDFPLQNVAARTGAGCEDMIDLNHLHEAAILDNLTRRFHAQLPYTYTGEICLAVNPYQWLDALYSRDLHERYLAARARKELPPHVYAVSVAAYKHMSTHALNQSILVSGESGAGKTETTKIVMDNIAQIASTGAEQSTIQRILDVNPLLESFGNAKTKRNDNSSRFGKFTQLQFRQSQSGAKLVLCGAKCETYLLEKSRVVTQEQGERNYHIFYQLLHGSDEQERRAFGFDAMSTTGSFAYIAGDDPTMHKKDAKNFAKTKHALSLLALGPEEQATLFQILAGVLHLGQARLQQSVDNDESSCVEPESITIAAALLGLEESGMEAALCSRTMRAGGEVYSVPLKIEQAVSARDALSKAIYSNIFNWMVNRINQKLSASESRVSNAIGVLDIFGFESFQHNSFEQLCINYANEKLQQKFTEDVFKTVQDEYEQEQITWDHIAYADNQEVLALLEGKMGVISMLNEEIVRPKGSDEGFVGKLSSICRQQERIIQFSRLYRTQFTIHHYAASVTYEATGFLEKHKDALLPDLSNLMRESSLPFITQLFAQSAEAPEPTSRTKRFGSLCADSQTVGTQFKQSLVRLMNTINTTNVHYVRCIKPNSVKSASIIDAHMVLGQLRCAGVIEAIRITRAGYPNRMKFAEFLSAFDLFLTKEQRTRMSEAQQGRMLVKQFELVAPEEYQIGKTKIYLQKGILERLHAIKAERVFAAVARIQSQWKGFAARRRYQAMRVAIRLVQDRVRVFLAVRRLRRCKAAALFMQCVWRGHVGRCRFHEVLMRVRVTQVQCAWRCAVAKRHLKMLQEERAREQARQRALEEERQRQLILRLERERAEQERQRAIEEEKQRQLRQKQERERAEQERQEALRRQREQEERERQEQLERERKAMEINAAIALQRIARGFVARKRYVEMQLEAQSMARLPILNLRSAAVSNDPEMREALEENERLRKQLQELLEANLDLESLVSEWKCEQQVLAAASLVEQTKLKHQLSVQRNKLAASHAELQHLSSYMTENGVVAEVFPINPAEDHDDALSDPIKGLDSTLSMSMLSSSTMLTPSELEPIDRPSEDMFKPRTTLSSRFRAGAKTIGRAKRWVTPRRLSRAQPPVETA